MEQKKVIVVVVTYNRKELLKECLSALKKQDYGNLQILVVDNNSTDGTQDYINDLIDDKKVVYFNTGENLGGAGGFNLGMKKALQLGCDYIWLMDDDCIVQKDTLNAFLNFAKEKNDDFGFLSSVVKWTDGSICKMNVQKTSISKKVQDFTTSKKIKIATFVSLLLKTEVVENMGLPIKEFFIWGDDVEYTYRIAKKFNSYLVADSVVTHKCKENIGSDISKDSPERLGRYFYAYRNEGYFYRKNGFGLWFFLKKIMHIKRILFSKCTNKKERLKIIKQGAKAAKKFNPKIEFAYRKNHELKVLEFFCEPLEYGGQEAFMVNMYKNFNYPNITYTLCTPFDLTNENLIKIARNRKEIIKHYDYNFNSKLRKLYVIKAMRNILKENVYDVVHIQSGSIYSLYVMAKLAKKYGVKKVIVHSHATGKMNFKYKLIKYFSDKRICKYADEFLACSDLAAEWKFPKNIIENQSYHVIKNGIDTEKFVFNPEMRKKYRENFEINDEFVLCNVGRFAYMKNHKFMIKIAEWLTKNKVNYKFILVGDGELKEETIKQIKDLNLMGYFIFLEKRNDIAQIMMASDVFVFPSIFEGLGIVAIEAQAVGLPVVCSMQIPSETKLTDIINYVDLSNLEKWIKNILCYQNKKINRDCYAEKIKHAGYDAKTSANVLEEIYLGVYNK